MVRRALTRGRAQLFWLYPLAAAASYYSGLLRASEETDKRSSRSSANSDNRGLTVKIVSEVRSVYWGVSFLLGARLTTATRPAELSHPRHAQLLPLLLCPPPRTFPRLAHLVPVRLDRRRVLLLRVRFHYLAPYRTAYGC